MVVWQLRGENQDCERRAVRLIGVTLFALAAYLAVESIGDLTLIADAAESAFCAFTSAAALLALGLNAWPGWWRAAPQQLWSSPRSPPGKASKPGKRTDCRGADRAARQSRRRSAAVTPGHTLRQPRRDRGDDPPGNATPGT